MPEKERGGMATRGVEYERAAGEPGGFREGERSGVRADRLTGEDLAVLLDGMRMEEESHLMRLRALLSGLAGREGE